MVSRNKEATVDLSQSRNSGTVIPPELDIWQGPHPRFAEDSLNHPVQPQYIIGKENILFSNGIPE